MPDVSCFSTAESWRDRHFRLAPESNIRIQRVARLWVFYIINSTHDSSLREQSRVASRRFNFRQYCTAPKISVIAKDNDCVSNTRNSEVCVRTHQD